jgi:hypothetical protein
LLKGCCHDIYPIYISFSSAVKLQKSDLLSSLPMLKARKAEN